LTQRSKRIFVVFLVVFIDLLGFGIVIPLLPSFSQDMLQMREGTIGLVAGIFSLMQFLFSPLWGRLSDIYGRKPIIVFSLSGNVLSYIVLGLVFSGVFRSILILFLARAMAGFFSANIGAAMAYISDVTDTKDRSKGMGIIGAAFGLGFVFGPFTGGILAQNFGYGVPVFLAAFLSLTALIFAVAILEESLPEQFRHQKASSVIRIGVGTQKMIEALKHPHVGFLIILYFIITFSVANTYATFQIFAESKDGFSYNVEQISYLFAYIGLIGAIVQGGLIRQLVKYFDERKLLIAGNLLMAVGLGAVPYSHHNLLFLLVSLFLLSVGNGLNQPITLSFVSKFSNPDEQGGILGINQSLSSLARFLGPSWGGYVYEYIGFASPFLTGGIFMLGGTLLSLKLLHDRYSKPYIEALKTYKPQEETVVND
jgi:DHA1 family tetracycline resistance protein-like MFS transporter